MSVDACCQECLGLIRQNLKEGIELQYMPSSAPVEVCTVEIWMKRVLLGLLNNANKFTESGFIRLSYEEDKPNRLVRFIIEDPVPESMKTIGTPFSNGSRRSMPSLRAPDWDCLLSVRSWN